MILRALIFSLALIPGTGAAQGYPFRPVKILVPAQPGGGLDLVGRVMAEQLGRALGQSFVVENSGGGGGSIAAWLARTVGPTGVVYAQDSAAVIERFVKDKFDIRAQKPVMKNVVHVIRNFDDPIPPDVGGLDLITFFFAYHDITYMEVDRAAMNQKMFAALKPGGFLIIADHSARPGDGTTVAKTLHRIEEKTLRQEIEAAGFKLAGEADFLRHPEDPRDAAVFRPQIPPDEFVLKYQKPL